MISHHLSIDNSLLSSQKNFNPIGQKTYAHIWNNWYFGGNFGPLLGQLSTFINETKFIR